MYLVFYMLSVTIFYMTLHLFALVMCQVLRSVTTKWTFQAWQVVAVCFKDVKSFVSSIEDIRVVVKANKMGGCNKSKDFIPAGSTDTIIKRSINNTYSRKATLVWLDVLPADLVDNLLKRGKNIMHVKT